MGKNDVKMVAARIRFGILMNAIIGNPLNVVLVMAMAPWLISIGASVVLALMCEWIVERADSRPSCSTITSRT
jgi:hypothetical protein